MIDDFLFRHEQAQIPKLVNRFSYITGGTTQKLTDDGRVIEVDHTDFVNGVWQAFNRKVQETYNEQARMLKGFRERT